MFHLVTAHQKKKLNERQTLLRGIRKEEREAVANGKKPFHMKKCTSNSLFLTLFHLFLTLSSAEVKRLEMINKLLLLEIMLMEGMVRQWSIKLASQTSPPRTTLACRVGAWSI